MPRRIKKPVQYVLCLKNASYKHRTAIITERQSQAGPQKPPSCIKDLHKKLGTLRNPGYLERSQERSSNEPANPADPHQNQGTTQRACGLNGVAPLECHSPISLGNACMGRILGSLVDVLPWRAEGTGGLASSYRK